jgi:hypothetical protein
MSIINKITNDFHIILNGELFEVHSTIESAKKTVRAMRKSGDYDSTDKIIIIEVN